MLRVMSRVFSKPRYKWSSESNLLNLAARSGHLSLLHELAERLTITTPATLRAKTRRVAQAASGFREPTSDPDDHNDYMRYVHELDRIEARRILLNKRDNINGFITFCEENSISKILPSHEFQVELYNDLLKEERLFGSALAFRNKFTAAGAILANAAGHSCINTRITEVLGRTIPASAQSHCSNLVSVFFHKYQVLEEIAHHNSSKQCRMAYLVYSKARISKRFLARQKKLLEDVDSTKRFVVQNSALERLSIPFVLYRYGYEIVVKYKNKFYFATKELFLDLASVMRSLALALFTAATRTADSPEANEQMGNDVLGIIKWISRNYASNHSTIARHMHICYNAFFQSVEEDDAWSVSRCEALLAEAKTVADISPSYFEVLSANKDRYRDMLDIGKLYHVLPPTEIDADQLCNKVFAAYNDKNQIHVRDSDLHEFLMFCRAFDASRLVTKLKKSAYVAYSDDSPIKDENWYKSCLKGIETIPDRALWDKIAISPCLAYVHHGDTWFYSAADVTHVSHDHKVGSELIHTLDHGDVFSCGKTFNEIRNGVRSHAHRHCVYVAGKSENTKVGEKVRETLSANDCFREVFSEIDKNARTFGRMLPGFMLGKDSYHTEKIFARMAERTRHKDNVCASSHDISGWSTNMVRKVMIAHHKMIMSYYRDPIDPSVWDWWDKLDIIFNKSTTERSGVATTGAFQGFTGALDTIMHIHLMLYTQFLARENGVLPTGVQSTIAALIDDCAFIVETDDVFTAERKTHWFTHLVTTYRKLGFVVDPIKSIVSNKKFIFLNKLFIDGVEVIQPIKVGMKIGKSTISEYCSVFDHIQTIFTSSAAAASSGADPASMYFISCVCALKALEHFYPKLFSVPVSSLVAACLAPRSFGGVGFPWLTHWLTQEVLDKTTDFMYNVFHCTRPHIKKKFLTLICASNANNSAWTIAEDPFTVRKSWILDPIVSVRHTAQRCLAKRKLSVFWDAMFKGEHMDAIKDKLEEILTSEIHSALYIPEVAGKSCVAFREEFLTKMIRSGAVAKLMSPVQRGRILTHLHVMTTSHIGAVLYRVSHPTAEDWEPAPENVFKEIEAYKKLYLAENGITFNDIVIPPPFAVLVPCAQSAKASLPVQIKPHLVPDGTGVDSLCSGWYPGKQTQSTKTKHAWSETGRIVNSQNPMALRFSEGCAVLSMLWEKGYSVSNLTVWFNATWGVDSGISASLNPHCSIKRINSRHVSTNHMVRIAPLAQNCVTVSGGRLFEFVKGTIINPFGALVQARASVLFNVTYLPVEHEMGFGFNFSIRKIPTIAAPVIAKYEAVDCSELKSVFAGAIDKVFLEAYLTDNYPDAYQNTTAVVLGSRKVHNTEMIVYYPQEPPPVRLKGALTDDLIPVYSRVRVPISAPADAHLRGKLAAVIMMILRAHDMNVDRAENALSRDASYRLAIINRIDHAISETLPSGEALRRVLSEVNLIPFDAASNTWKQCFDDQVSRFLYWGVNIGCREISHGSLKYDREFIVKEEDTVEIVRNTLLDTVRKLNIQIAETSDRDARKTKRCAMRMLRVLNDVRERKPEAFRAAALFKMAGEVRKMIKKMNPDEEIPPISEEDDIESWIVNLPDVGQTGDHVIEYYRKVARWIATDLPAEGFPEYEEYSPVTVTGEYEEEVRFRPIITELPTFARDGSKSAYVPPPEASDWEKVFYFCRAKSLGFAQWNAFRKLGYTGTTFEELITKAWNDNNPPTVPRVHLDAIEDWMDSDNKVSTLEEYLGTRTSLAE